MHFYSIPVGTKGILITNHQDSDVETKSWVTRRPLTFTETVHDPLREANEQHAGQRSIPHDSLLGQLARQGYAIFGGDPGSNSNVQYLLAVPYSITQKWQEGLDR